jgi:hypothetical protein
MMIGRMIAPGGVMMSLSGQEFRKLRFQMIADMISRREWVAFATRGLDPQSTTAEPITAQLKSPLKYHLAK